MTAQGAPEVEIRLLPSGDEAGTAPDDRRFRPDVEGLRALAVLLVVLYHAGLPRLTGGYVGVDVFFVISGFVITGLLLRERQGTSRTSILDFYARRVRRILPAATLVIAVTVIATFVVLGVVSGNTTTNDARWAAVFLANFHFEAIGTNYLTARLPPSPLQNYWSLSVEEQFYIVYPTLFLVVAALRSRFSLRSRLAALLTVIIVASYWLSVIQTSTHPSAAYFSPLTRAWELALGALVAVGTSWLRKLPAPLAAALTWAGAIAIVYSAFAFDSETAYPGSLVAVPVIGAALIIVGGTACPRWGTECVLGIHPVQWLGKRSYSLYLWHWPILILAAERVGESQLGFRQNIPYLIIAVLLSMVSYQFVENPLRHLRIPSRQTVMTGAIVVLATVLLLSLVLVMQTTAPTGTGIVPASNETAVVEAVAAAPQIKTIPKYLLPSLAETQQDFAGFNVNPATSCALSVLNNAIESNICTLGDPKGKKLLVLYGDSHALMWLPAFNSIARDAHWRLVVLASFFCPAELVTVSNPTPNGLIGPPNTLCDDFHTWSVDHINAMRPDLVVVAQSSLYDSPQTGKAKGGLFSRAVWGDGLVHLLQAIHVPPTHKIYLGDIPELPTDPPTCLSAHPDDVQACSAPVGATTTGFAETERKAVARVGAQFIDPTPWFCSTVCTPIVSHYGVYRDQLHMTGTYALYLQRVLGAALGLQ
jgi:peptidoglycan/LPS O-acetylase OafA/YrhL